MDKAKFDFTASSQVLDILQANPGITLSATDVRKAQLGELTIAGSFFPPLGRLRSGCISILRYQADGNDLAYIKVGTVGYSKSQIQNLDSFRDRLQEAANFGHKISFCYYPQDRKMTMLNIYPCGCDCKDED